MASTKPKKQPARVEDHLVAGTIAGLASTIALFPLDLIKTQYQVYDFAGRPYTSLYQGLRTIVKAEGIPGLYKGLSPALVANGVSWGGYFLLYEAAKNRYLKHRHELNTVQYLLSAFEAGIIMVFVTNPMWLIKTRMQLQTKAAIEQGKAYKGIMDATSTIIREEGYLGLYKGVLPALLLTSHGAIQFGVYEWLKKLVEPYNMPSLGYSVLGGTAKIVAGFATYPYQVVKARLQQRDVGTSRWHYSGTWDCIVKIWRYEGLMGFFKGCVPNILKVAPAAAITFVVYEECLQTITVWRDGGGSSGRNKTTASSFSSSSTDSRRPAIGGAAPIDQDTAEP